MKRYLGWGKRRVLRYFMQALKQKQQARLLQQRLAVGENFPEVRIAVSGAGKFALAHLKVLSSISNVKIVGVSNRGNSDISHFKPEFGVEKVFSDYRLMLDETRPDGVFILVSHFETFRVASECLRRKIPCLIEKPAGLMSGETVELAKLAEDNHCLNMVALNRRFIFTIQVAFAYILERGPLVGIVINAPEAIRRIRAVSRHDPRLYDNWLIANNIHAIDLFRCLGGEVEGIESFRNSREEPNGDSFTSIMRLDKCCLGTYTSHWNSAGGWSLELFGEGIKAEISLSNYAAKIYQGRKQLTISPNPVDKLFNPGLYAQNQTFVNALALDENLGYPASDLADSTKTMKLIEMILKGKTN